MCVRAYLPSCDHARVPESHQSCERFVVVPEAQASKSAGEVNVLSEIRADHENCIGRVVLPMICVFVGISAGTWI